MLVKLRRDDSSGIPDTHRETSVHWQWTGFYASGLEDTKVPPNAARPSERISDVITDKSWTNTFKNLYNNLFSSLSVNGSFYHWLCIEQSAPVMTNYLDVWLFRLFFELNILELNMRFIAPSHLLWLFLLLNHLIHQLSWFFPIFLILYDVIFTKLRILQFLLLIKNNNEKSKISSSLSFYKK